MNNKTKALKTFSLFFILIFSIVSVSALSMIGEFDNRLNTKSIMPGQSAGYNVLVTADQSLDKMNINGKLYDTTTGETVFLGNLFDATTSATFYYPSEFFVDANQYQNLPGKYIIEITAQENLTNGFSETKTTDLKLNVLGNRPPIANFTYSPQTITTITPVTFTSTSYDTDGYLVKQEWFIDGAKVGDGKTLVYTFNQARNYNVTLRVTDNGGATATHTEIITVGAGPITGYPVANFTNSTSLCSNTNVVFTSTSYDPNGNIALEEWDLNNDGVYEISGLHSVSKLFSNPGTYTIWLKVTDNSGLVSTISTAFSIMQCQAPPTNIAPVANFTYVPSSPFAGDNVVFTSTSYDPDGFIAKEEWDLNGDGVYEITGPAGQTPSKNFANAGSYTVNLRVTDNLGLTATATKTIVVSARPPANIAPFANFTYTPANPIVGDNVVFTSTSYDVDGTIVAYEWFVNGNLLSNNQQLFQTFTQAGVYTVTLRVTDDDGAKGSITKDVVVTNPITTNIPPVANFTYSPSNPNEGDTVTFTSTSYDVDGTIVAYLWFVDGVNVANTQNMAFSFTEGTHSVILRVTDDDGATDDEAKTISVGKSTKCGPEAVLRVPESVTMNKIVKMDGLLSTAGCPDASIAAYRWQIYKQAALLSDNLTTTPYYNYTFTQSGEYKVVLTVYTNTSLSDSDEKLVYAGTPVKGLITEGEDDGLYVDYFDVTGSEYGVINLNDDFTVSATVSNDRDEDINHLRITFSIPELGYEIKSDSFNLDAGHTKTVSMNGYLDFTKEEVPAGEYYAFIGASDTDTIRVKYFPLVIKN